MPAATKTKKAAPKKAVSNTSAAKPAKPPAVKKPPVTKERMTVAAVMSFLEKVGTAQARKIYLRHGMEEPMFGVSFADLGKLQKRIGVDHDLAEQLFATRNADAVNLAVKIADPARMSPEDLDRWAGVFKSRMCGGYIAHLTVESPHGRRMADQWRSAGDDRRGCAGWNVVGGLAMRDPSVPDAWFAERLGEIERGIHAAANRTREAMNMAMISIGGRSPALHVAALAVAKKVGKVEVDHGETSCETPDARPYLEKMWARAKGGGFPTPAAHEQSRASPRTRC